MGRPEQPQRQLTTAPNSSSKQPFSEILKLCMRPVRFCEPPAGCRNKKERLCQLCLGSRLDYSSECQVKTSAVQQWGKQYPDLGDIRFVASPQGRGYRCVSKRRWLPDRHQLVMVESVDYGKIRGIAVQQCQVEPPFHAKIYRQLQQELSQGKVGSRLNYAILKSTPQATILLLNMTDPGSHRAEINRISKRLTRSHPQLQGIWLLKGESGDDYYLNVHPGHSQKLHGLDALKSEQNLLFSPLCFTQINPFAVKSMLKITQDWLGDSALPLLDLYCGYGLFSLASGRTGPSYGFEISREAIHWARRNGKRLHQNQARFDTWDLSQPLPDSRMPQGDWVAVLDPPRSGASAKLIEQLASHEPQRVVHWICDIEQTAPQVDAWIKTGYFVREAVALDMFPGSDNIELGLLLEPGSSADTAKTSGLSSKVGESPPCKSPKKPARSPVSSTERGARPNPPEP